MRRLVSIVQLFASVPTMLAVVALFTMMVMTFADVILRSSFDAPIEAATELTRILMAILVFAALPSVSGRDEHITVDLIDGFFSKTAARWRDAVICLACGGMLWLPAGRVAALAERARSYGDVTEYLGIPEFYIAWFIAVFTYLTAVVLVARGVILLFSPSALEPGDD